MSMISQVQRGYYTKPIGLTMEFLGVSIYEPPSLELYTYFQKKSYLMMFLALHLLQIISILVSKRLLLKNSSVKISKWEMFITAVEQSHFPFPYEDWDAKKGGCLDHIRRKNEGLKEFVTITTVNLLFNFVSLFLILILCKYLLKSFLLLSFTSLVVNFHQKFDRL